MELNKKKSSTSIYSDRTLLLIWKVAHSPNNFSVSFRRSLVQLDLIECMRSIQRASRQLSLQAISNLMFGLSKILRCQSTYNFNVRANIIWTNFNLEFQQSNNNDNNRKVSDPNQSTSFSNFDNFLQLIADIDQELFDTDKMYCVSDNNNNRHNFERHNYCNKNQLSEKLPPIASSQSINSGTDVEEYFDQLYDQINQVDFVDEFQDILDEHFGQKRRSSQKESLKRFSDLHSFNDDDDGEFPMDIENEFDDNSSVMIQAPKSKTSTKKGTCRTRKIRVRTQNKRIFGLNKLLNEWRGSKLGYVQLEQEYRDVKLTEPNLTMSVQLKQYFINGGRGESDDCESMIIQDEDPTKEIQERLRATSITQQMQIDSVSSPVSSINIDQDTPSISPMNIDNIEDIDLEFSDECNSINLPMIDVSSTKTFKDHQLKNIVFDKQVMENGSIMKQIKFTLKQQKFDERNQNSMIEFRSLIDENSSRTTVANRFCALLTMNNQSLVELNQTNRSFKFGDILISIVDD